MRTLTLSDYELLERLFSTGPREMLQVLTKYLRTKYDKVVQTKDYVYAIGEQSEVALVAHLDTVYARPVKDLYYDQTKGVLWSPDGLGADDRAGVFAIIKIIEGQLRPSIIFTMEEETGGLGALALSKLTCPFPNLKYIIELDRRGSDDCVFYDCYNPDFVKYIESFGFVERFGSFSDISILCPAWKICGVNLSIGYEDEHSISETLHIAPLFATIKKVKKMVVAKDIPFFTYKDRLEVMNQGDNWYSNLTYDYGDYISSMAHCVKCGHLFSEYELFPVKSGNSIKYYCPDCVTGNVKWCVRCQEPYETATSKDNKYCDDCVEEAMKVKA